MLYAWCKLIQTDETHLIRKAIIYAESEQKFIEKMSEYLRKYKLPTCINSFPDVYDDCIEQNLTFLENSQNFTGYDISNSTIKNRQLCISNGKITKTLDLRNYHDEIKAHIKAFANEKISYTYKKRTKQGRTHIKSGEYRWHKYGHNTLTLISQNKFRKKYASGYMTSYTYDPKCITAENNWKSDKKCKHQWQRHLKKHQDCII